MAEVQNENDIPQGALTALANSAGASQEAAQPASSPFEEMLKTSQQRALAGQRALDARRDQLLNLSQQRMFNPTLMKFAGGMLAPTKTGGFGESLGYAANAAAEEQEKEFARQQAFAKLGYEMEIESAKQKEDMDVNQMLLQMQKGQPKADLALSGSPVVAGTPTAAAAAPKTGISNIPDTQLQLMLGSSNARLQNIAKAELDLRKQRRESIKMVKFGNEDRPMYPEEIAELKTLSDSGDMVGLQKFYRRYGVPFPYIKDASDPSGYRIPSDTEKKALEEREKGKYGEQKEYSIPYAGGMIERPFTPFQYVEFMEALGKGEGDAYINKLFPKAKMLLELLTVIVDIKLNQKEKLREKSQKSAALHVLKLLKLLVKHCLNRLVLLVSLFKTLIKLFNWLQIQRLKKSLVCLPSPAF